MKQIPKPLLILVVVLIILAVIGLGASFLAFPDDGPANDQDEARDGLTDFLGDVFPEPEPVVLLSTDALIDPNTTCLNANELQLANDQTCVVQIRPTDDLRRQLELEVLQNRPVLFKVRQQGGETPEPTKVVPFDDGDGTVRSVSVVVSRGENATVTLRCQSIFGCRVAVNPPGD